MEFMTKSKLEEIKDLFKRHQRLDYAFLNEMRSDIEQEPEKFIISEQEFDALFNSKPEFVETGSITIDNFDELIADFEVKFSKQLLEIAETEDCIPEKTQTQEELKHEEFFTDDFDDDETDPEVTLDQIVDGVLDSGRLETMKADDKYKLFH